VNEKITLLWKGYSTGRVSPARKRGEGVKSVRGRKGDRVTEGNHELDLDIRE
jgi:hypothetical protein